MAQGITSKVRTTAGALVLAAGLLGGAGVAAAPAQAATAAKPSCVSVSHSVGIATQTVTVKNRCRYRVSLVLKRLFLDGPCVSVGANRWRSFKWARSNRYDGIRWWCV
ncbi:hypothetical protein [Nonomuraea basaltis]|uniref:hypothetical protein n=1 Tax=Nonomuraea basaltis TaxID=2495887 RepID=UPI00110C4A6B|nr:hypothetical protein [Nonomuraea basaltis]TMR94766.1 hypothetical protein EJK15_32140 [Nonomuraea basaltis]